MGECECVFFCFSGYVCECVSVCVSICGCLPGSVGLYGCMWYVCVGLWVCGCLCMNVCVWVGGWVSVGE